MKKVLLCLFLLTAGCFVNAIPVAWVTNNNDSGLGSLRTALALVDDGGMIFVRIGYNADTIQLKTPLPIIKSVCIYGTDATSGINLTLDGAYGGSIMNIDCGARVAITNVTLTRGNDSAIKIINGTLDMSNCTIENSIANYGGGINVSSGSLLDITNSTINNNISSNGSGGGIYCEGVLNISGCTITNNASYGTGSAICVYGANSLLNMFDSTVTLNTSITATGAIANFSAMPSSINACTIYSNYSQINNVTGVGLANSGLISCYNSIISSNSNSSRTISDVSNGGIISNEGFNAVGPTTGYTWSANGNWITAFDAKSIFTKVGNTTNTGYLYLDASLKNNGGPTQTLALTNSMSVANSVYRDFYKNSPDITNGYLGSCNVAISKDGNTLVMWDNINLNKYLVYPFSGAYVYVYQNGGWCASGYIPMSDNGGQDNKGIAISEDGKTIIAADCNKNVAYAFYYSNNTWVQTDTEDINNITGVAIAHNEVDVGNSNEVMRYSCNNGKLSYIGFRRANDGRNLVSIAMPTEDTSLIVLSNSSTTYACYVDSPDLIADKIGDIGGQVAVSADGNTVAVGNGGQNTVCIYGRNSNGTWSQLGSLDNGGDGGNFGSSVAMSDNGNIIVVSAPSVDTYDNNGCEFTGAAYIFERYGNAWVLMYKFIPDEDQLYSPTGTIMAFATNVTISGDGAKVITPGVYYHGSPYMPPTGGGPEPYVSYITLSATDSEPSVDQRGYSRVNDNPKSIGAYEYGATP